MSLKQCSKCNLHLPLEDFHKNKKYKDGREYWCKDCTSKRMKQQYEDNIDARRTASLLSYHKNKDLEKIRARNIRRRYKLSVDEYDRMMLEGCYVCGSLENLVVDHDHNCCSGKETCGNCIRGVLCWGHNIADGQFKSTEEIERYLEYRRNYESTS